eukprot:TRINITY_DN22307_c0_g1_i1.p1 TRINITY_DN22307_c0_g1~~TRINITY_DN22307_c0_g1_i1.p1  ORF type:complete len:763 (+),score=158.67 TRINITY_DN22307_c0_g1_i1:86-2374(+)
MGRHATAGAVTGTLFYHGSDAFSNVPDTYHSATGTTAATVEASDPRTEDVPPALNLDSAVPTVEGEDQIDEDVSDAQYDARSRSGSLAPSDADSQGRRRKEVHVDVKVFNQGRWADSKEKDGSRRMSTMRSTIEVQQVYWQMVRKSTADVLQSPKFDFFIGLIILMNAANIGMEQTYRGTGQYADWISTFEDIFLTVYVLELVARFTAIGRASLADGWVRFDLFLVVLGVATQWIISPIFGDLNEVGPLMVLRTARLLRLGKTVRLLIKFRELWMLVRGLLNSANTMLYTLLMLFVILYIFACLIMELLFEHPKLMGEGRVEEFAEAVDANFSSIPHSMLTLLQFVCFDNIVLIYKPLVMHDFGLLFYFILVILVVGIVVMNLVTAVIVNSALEQTAQDKDLMKSIEEEKRKQVLKDLRRMFQRLDEDGSGEVSREEIQSVSDADKEILRNLTSMEDPVEIFDALDVDGSGDIGIDEFCDGLWQVAISNAPIEIKRMEKQVEYIRAQMKEAQSHRDHLQHTLGEVLRELRTLTGYRQEEPVSPKTPTPSSVWHRQAPIPEFQKGIAAPAWADDMLQELSELRRTSVTMALAAASEKLSINGSDRDWIGGVQAAKAAVPAVLRALDETREFVRASPGCSIGRSYSHENMEELSSPSGKSRSGNKKMARNRPSPVHVSAQRPGGESRTTSKSSSNGKRQADEAVHDLSPKSGRSGRTILSTGGELPDLSLPDSIRPALLLQPPWQEEVPGEDRVHVVDAAHVKM